MASLSTENFNACLKRTVARIRECTDVDLRTFLNMLGMSALRYSEIIMQRQEFSIQELRSLADALDIDLDLIFRDKVDYVALARHFRGDRSVFPEHYSEQSHLFGRAKAAQVIYSHLASYHGESFGRAYFRRFQLHPEAFSNPTDFVSPMIASDLVKGLAKEGYREEHIRSIGTMTYATCPPPLRRKLAAMKDTKTLYLYLYEELVGIQYDRMSDYKIVRLSDRGCTSIVRTREEAQEAFKRKVIDNRESCLYRQGAMSSFSAHTGPSFSTVRETSCIHRGDEVCTLEFRWN
ncbi:MAG: hypothetical protein HY074_03735 [Deltaproteobacteria bacterium]|nr:hypothetical protein [Deltaproteobacteria bacterium]